jgi:hypothetical protein
LLLSPKLRGGASRPAPFSASSLVYNHLFSPNPGAPRKK